ncbi:hypothetical protein B0H11DRAFT_1996786 [Mycena galericulata]|nr:hypothetical protein B0H11DRAFT_1996786 [Mycena galericulata]
MSPEFRGHSIPGSMIVAGRSAPQLSFPYQCINTPLDSPPRFSAHGILPVTALSQPPIQNSHRSGLKGLSSTSTFLTFPPSKLPPMFSFTQAPASISRYPSLPNHPNSPPWNRISAVENPSVDPEARGTQPPTISRHKRGTEEIDSYRPPKKAKPITESQSRQNPRGISICNLLLDDPS